jgi:hypothetical protein
MENLENSIFNQNQNQSQENENGNGKTGEDVLWMIGCLLMCLVSVFLIYFTDLSLGDRIQFNQKIFITGKMIDIITNLVPETMDFNIQLQSQSHYENSNSNSNSNSSSMIQYPLNLSKIGEYHRDGTIHYYSITDGTGKKYYVEPAVWDTLIIHKEYICSVRIRRCLPHLEIGYTPFITDADIIRGRRY